jgi:hypothetical protein
MTDTTKPALYALTPEQHATVIAALLYHAASRLEKEVTNELAGKVAPAPAPITTVHGVLQPLDSNGTNQLIKALNHTGLDFSAIVPMFAIRAQHDPYVKAAREKQEEGEIEVDDPAIVSRGDDDGAYVMGWMWVSNREAGFGDITGEVEEPKFRNHYRHCGQEWEDVWSCECNDRCPVCNKEIEPYASDDLTEEKQP